MGSMATFDLHVHSCNMCIKCNCTTYLPVSLSLHECTHSLSPSFPPFFFPFFLDVAFNIPYGPLQGTHWVIESSLA